MAFVVSGIQIYNTIGQIVQKHKNINDLPIEIISRSNTV